MRRSAGRNTLRAGAALAALLILGAWFASLWSQPALLQANVIRVLGALLGAGIAWFTYDRSRAGLPWQRCLAAGVAGSLAATGLSVFVPALGEFTFAGWLASGVVGGAAVVLLGYAWTGPPVEVATPEVAAKGPRED